MRDLVFGLMGCGRITKKHVSAIQEVEGATLAAVCDVLEDRSREWGEKAGVPHYLDVDRMLQDHPEIDVVCILTPSGYHAKHCVQVAAHGKHVVVEKPMALRLKDADEMIMACDSAGVRLFVVKQNRYNVPIQRLRRAMEEGRFGKLVLGTARVRWCRHQAYYDQDEWRGTWALDGGVLANQASHHIDLLEWMMGDVASVFAKTATQLVDVETEDTAVVVLKFVNGALGIVEATTATRPSDLEGSISILGEHGTVIVGGFAANEMKEWRFTDERPEDAAVVGDTKTMPDDVYGFGHKAFLNNVVTCIREGGAALVDGLEGRRSLELINAIYESVEIGQEVPLRFTPTHCRLGEPNNR